MSDKFTNSGACINPELGVLLSAYELGGLSAQEERQFESHLEACAHCRAEMEAMIPILSSLSAGRSELMDRLRAAKYDYSSQLEELAGERSGGPAVTARHTAARGNARGNGWRIFGPNPVAVTVAFAVLIFMYVAADLHTYRITDDISHESPPVLPGDPAGLQDEKPAVRTITNAALLALVTRDPLPFFPVTARGDVMSATEDAFRLAMQPYSAGDYQMASRLLSEFVRTHPIHDRGRLYLGVTAYLAGDYTEALQHLRAAGNLSDLRSDQAGWYAANAWLAIGQIDSARRLLGEISRGGGEYSADAATMIVGIAAVSSEEGR